MFLFIEAYLSWCWFFFHHVPRLFGSTATVSATTVRLSFLPLMHPLPANSFLLLDLNCRSIRCGPCLAMFKPLHFSRSSRAPPFKAQTLLRRPPFCFGNRDFFFLQYALFARRPSPLSRVVLFVRSLPLSVLAELYHVPFFAYPPQQGDTHAHSRGFFRVQPAPPFTRLFFTW